MSEPNYRYIDMNNEYILKLRDGILHINDQPLPGALTWLWDNLTLDPKPIDPGTTGVLGAERRRDEAKYVQYYREWDKYEKNIVKKKSPIDRSIWDTINEVEGKEIPVNIIVKGVNYIVFIEEYLPSENRIRVRTTNAKGTLEKGSLWHFTVSNIQSICPTHSKY